MKVEQVQPKPQFRPIVITLETQEEVDALFTVVNHIKIITVLPALDNWFEKLKKFGSNDKTWTKFCKIFK